MQGKNAKKNGVAAVSLHGASMEAVETLARRLTTARDVDTLAGLAPEVRRIAADLLDCDAGAGMVTRVVSALNDALTVRVIELVTMRRRLPVGDWCWLALGSEGREEQTFVTDQDNGIVFAAADAGEARALRPLFMAFAGEVNQALAVCGFPLCEGGVMAGNAECCLSLHEWRERFAGWVRTPEPQALLNATIYFDLRALFGAADLVADLRGYLARLVKGADAFLRLMATNALTAEAPVGVLRDFVLQEGMLDLKKSGARLFVDAARIFALDCPHSGTVARLRHAAANGTLPANEAAAAAAAFHQLQRIRLTAQQGPLAAGAMPDHRLAPEDLNPFDRAVLHEALKQARLLQQKLKIAFRLEG